MSSQHVTQNTLSIDVATSRNPATDELIATYAFQTADEVEGVRLENGKYPTLSLFFYQGLL